MSDRDKPWTRDEVERVREWYLIQSHPLKFIATRTGRTVSAISKKISRMGFRAPKTVSSPRSSSKSFPSNSKKTFSPSSPLKKMPIMPHLDPRHWTTMDKVVQEGWRLTRIFIAKHPTDPYYEMNGLPISEAQVLMRVNMMRVERGLSILFVEGVTEA